MEKRIISIDVTPKSSNENIEDAGVMWEHNATEIHFKIDPAYIGDYRYYLEYRSLIGTKDRTQFLELNTANNVIVYTIPVSMSSLKGVECYFNIVKFDGDGNTIQIIKPKKFGLTFDFSPDTDNSLAKVNDFSVNALMEAIRLGVFKGEKGDKGDKGNTGEKGDKGDAGEVMLDYAHKTFAPAIKGKKTGETIFIDDATSIGHKADVVIKNKNLWKGKSVLGEGTYSYTQEVNITEPIVISLKRSDDLTCSANVWRVAVYYRDGSAGYISDKETASTYSEIFNATEQNPIEKITVRETNITSGNYYDIQVEVGEVATEYVSPIMDFSETKLFRSGKNMWGNGDVTVESAYITIALDYPLIAGHTYTLSADVESADTDKTTCLVYGLTTQEILGQIERGKRKSITFTLTEDIDKITFYASNNSANGENDSASFKNIQLELGENATEFEAYSGAEWVCFDAEGCAEANADGKSTVLIPKEKNVLLEVEYSRDLGGIIEKLYNAVVNLGGVI